MSYFGILLPNYIAVSKLDTTFKGCHINHSHNFLYKKCNQQPTNCLSVLDHFVGLALKGLNDQTLCMK